MVDPVGVVGRGQYIFDLRHVFHGKMATKKEVDDIARAVSGAVSSVLSKSRRRYSGSDDEYDSEPSSRKKTSIK